MEYYWITNKNKKQQQEEYLQDELLRKRISVYGRRVNLMTDDQIKLLKQQTSLYQTLSQQLYAQFTAHHDFTGIRLGTISSDPLTSTARKIPARPRWTPKPFQLQYLETVYEQCNGTPSKQEIKNISAELVHHGPITETNVYNWFQNRRARSKRKQPTSAENENKGESEKSDECSKEVNNAKAYDDRPDSPLIAEQIFFQVPHEGIDQLIGKTEASRSCSGFSMQ